MLTRRKLAIGWGAFASSAILDARLSFADPGPTDLAIPMLVDAAKQGNAVHLKAMSGRHAFIEGKPTGTYGYSAPVVGPVMRVRRGDEVQVTVENALDKVTTVHWHGLLAPGYNDGGPQQLIQPAGNWRPLLKINQPAATLWFQSSSASRYRSPDLYGPDRHHDHR
jgi:blue copper oxidase